MSGPTDREPGTSAPGGEDADRGLGDLLARLEPPEHGAGFWESLDGVLASDGQGGPKAAEAGAEGRDAALGARLRRLPLPAHKPEFWKAVEGTLAAGMVGERPRRRRTRRRIVAAAAIAAAATFLVAAWFGLPGGFDGGVGRALAHVFLPPLETTATTPAKVTGDELVWTSRGVTNPSTGVYDVDVFARDLSSGRSRALSTSASSKQLVAAGDGKVAWIDERGGAAALVVDDLRSGLQTRVAELGVSHAPAATGAQAPATDVALSGDTVIWIDHHRGDGDLWAYDLATHETVPVCLDRWSQSQPAISGATVVWVDGRDDTYGTNGPYYLNGSDIFGHDFSTGLTFPICRAADDQLDPAVSGPIVVWQDGRHRTSRDPGNWDIYGYDLRTGREFAIADGEGSETHPAISGNVVLWTEQYAAPGADGRASSLIMGRDLKSGRSFVVSGDPGPYDDASISGSTAVWCSLGRDGTPIAVFGAQVFAHDGRPEVLPLGR